MKMLFRLLPLFILLIAATSYVLIQTSETKLQIIVIDHKGENVPGADIIIYSSEEDYNKKENQLIIGKTDKKGIFQYKGLGTKSYFLEVSKDDLTNAGEDVQTGALSSKKMNKVIVILK